MQCKREFPVFHTFRLSGTVCISTQDPGEIVRDLGGGALNEDNFDAPINLAILRSTLWPPWGPFSGPKMDHT